MDGKKRMIPSSHSDAQGPADSNASPKTSRVSPPPSLTGMAVEEVEDALHDGHADEGAGGLGGAALVCVGHGGR